jgi:hypothetical protein
LLSEAALGDYVTKQFDEAVSDAYSRRVTWQATDSIENRLYGALLRAEYWADVSALRQARLNLAHYKVLTTIGLQDRQADAALFLLRRAGDEKAAGAVARAYWKGGPLDLLQRVVPAVLNEQWRAPERLATFALIAAGADVLTSRDAELAAKRLVADELRPREHDAAIRALASVVGVASARSQSGVARYALDVMRQDPGPIVADRLPLLIDRIDWRNVSKSVVDRWLRASLRAIQSTGDSLRPSAVEFLEQIAATGDRQVVREVSQHFRAAAEFDLLPILLNYGSSRDAALAVDALAQRVLGVLSEAEAGAFSVGGIDLADALVVALLRAKRVSSADWEPLLQFLSSPHVLASAKIGATNRLAGEVPRLPQEVKMALAKAPDAQAVMEPFGSAPYDWDGARLRLELALAAVESPDALVRVLSLAGGTAAGARLQAAWCIPLLREVVSAEVVIPIVLSLAQDRNVDVRAEGTRVAARLLRHLDGPLSETLRFRVATALGEPGVAVPARALVGITELAALDVRRARVFASPVAALAESHASSTVRQIARDCSSKLFRSRKA